MIILQLESLTPPFAKWGCFTIPIPWIQVIYYLVLKAVFSYFIYCLILFLILLIFFLFVRDTILTDILMTTNEAVHIFSFFSCAMITTVVSYHHCLSPSGCYMTGMAWVKKVSGVNTSMLPYLLGPWSWTVCLSLWRTGLRWLGLSRSGPRRLRLRRLVLAWLGLSGFGWRAFRLRGLGLSGLCLGGFELRGHRMDGFGLGWFGLTGLELRAG